MATSIENKGPQIFSEFPNPGVVASCHVRNKRDGLKCGMFRARIFILLMIAVVLGCGRGQNIVGEWTGETDVMGRTAALKIDFRQDGTFETVTRVQGPKGALVATDKGSWKLEGDKLASTVVDVDWNFEGLDAAQVEVAKSKFKEEKAKLIESANQDPVSTVSWEGNDTVILKDSTSELRLSRVK